MSEGLQAPIFKAKTQREATLVLAREVCALKDDIETTNLRLENIEGHLLSRPDDMRPICNRLTKLETINKAFYGVLAVVGGALIKIFAD